MSIHKSIMIHSEGEEVLSTFSFLNGNKFIKINLEYKQDDQTIICILPVSDFKEMLRELFHESN